jgi:hypothetical protein
MPTPVPTTAPPTITCTVPGDKDTFQQAPFIAKVAQAANLSTSNVVVNSVTAASVKVNFGFINLPVSQIVSTTNTFVALVQQNASSVQVFTTAYPVSNINSVTYTPAPVNGASSVVSSIIAVLIAVAALTFVSL